LGQYHDHSHSSGTGTVRFYKQAQVRQLLAAAGFTDMMFRGSEWEPASAEDSSFTVVGKRPL
jgi:hypothetical protein